MDFYDAAMNRFLSQAGIRVLDDVAVMQMLRASAEEELIIMAQTETFREIFPAPIPRHPTAISLEDAGYAPLLEVSNEIR